MPQKAPILLATSMQDHSIVSSSSAKVEQHFRWNGVTLVGLTHCGLVTIDVLNINKPIRMLLRQSLQSRRRSDRSLTLALQRRHNRASAMLDLGRFRLRRTMAS